MHARIAGQARWPHRQPYTRITRDLAEKNRIAQRPIEKHQHSAGSLLRRRVAQAQ
jgi:hypothetical protein